MTQSLKISDLYCEEEGWWYRNLERRVVRKEKGFIVGPDSEMGFEMVRPIPKEIEQITTIKTRGSVGAGKVLSVLKPKH
ncbi:unnamed protein product [Sphenostylis stenocarpa]|uniref:Uncharacterized protein n=1 Tax=Sphenostylis stenocarpa TaxID=92480 RepID=A0AA86RQF5_9FABA|nr:unnamed protein product [Sphenostylis stenocarpa]